MVFKHIVLFIVDFVELVVAFFSDVLTALYKHSSLFYMFTLSVDSCTLLVGEFETKRLLVFITI